MTPSPEPPPPAFRKPPQLCGPARYAMLGLGLVMAAIGIIGILLPGLPGTVFLLVALWAFSRSSERLQLWLYTHPRFGAGLRAWHTHRAIPVRAKIAAVLAMTVSLGLAIATAEPGSMLPVWIGLTLAAVAAWIVTRPSGAPSDS